MRTNFLLAMVMSLALAGALITGSGFAALVGQGDPTGGISENVNKTAKNTTLDDGKLSGENAPSDDDSIISLIIDGGKEIGDIVGMVTLLPLTLMNMGFPAWFAIPVGAPVTIIASIGVIQFVTGRVLR
jgi:hypothetical protein